MGVIRTPRVPVAFCSDPTFTLSQGSEADKFFRGKMPTSLDSMSPKNPALLAVAEIPVAPSVKAHSIIPVLGEGEYRQGKDGVVAYSSAHVDYVESEFIVRSDHSSQLHPLAIDEVRRILVEHVTASAPDLEEGK